MVTISSNNLHNIGQLTLVCKSVHYGLFFVTPATKCSKCSECLSQQQFSKILKTMDKDDIRLWLIKNISLATQT